MNLEEFKGKTIIDVIKSIPSIEWHCANGTSLAQIPIGKVTFVQYDTSKPVKAPDFTFRAKPSLLPSFVQHHTREDRCLGLASIISHEGNAYHLPMLDLDAHGKLDFLDDTQLVELYKTTIKRETEIERGVLLRSGPNRNFHFLCLGRLLTPEQYITFNGLALTMKYEHNAQGINLADSRNIGHSLTRFAHKAELGKSPSRYDQNERFSTIRITPKPGYTGHPVVVDFLG